MKRNWLLPFALAAVAAAGAQNLPQLDPPTGIDVRVQEFQWNSAGDALLYKRLTDKGIGIGTFVEGQKDGKVLLEIGKDDQMEWDWFSNSPIAIVVVYKIDPETKTLTGTAEIYELDAKNRNVYLLHRIIGDPEQKVDVNLDLSPSLIHGIFRIKQGNTIRHWILPSAKRYLTAAPDIDKAEAAGNSGPLWAMDGTAVYGPGLSTAAELRLESGVIRMKTGLDESKVAMLLEQENLIIRARTLEEISIAGKLYFEARRAPDVGAVVLNVLPSNGGIITVRFKGEYVPRLPKSVDVIVKPSENVYVFGRASESETSLWLANSDKNPTSGVLVSPKFDDVAVSNYGRNIGYVVDGALFVRRIRG